MGDEVGSIEAPDEQSRRQRREKLSAFYGNSQDVGRVQQPSPTASTSSSTVMGDGTGGERKVSGASSNPFDMNGTSFDSETYMSRLIRDASLSQLMAKESEVVREIHSLDSDMQTLVYENYNKFISATDTINKMRVDFRETDTEMETLAERMASITAASARVSETLKVRRQRTAELSATHALLKKLQFLFELPSKLKDCIENEDYALGVKYYVRAQKVLDQYEHMPSFNGIKSDCDEIMVDLRGALRSKLRNPETSPCDMAECVDLLLKLDQVPEELCQDYLQTVSVKLESSLDVLEQQVRLAQGEENVNYEATMDMLEFVDHGSTKFLSDVCLVIAAYNETFVDGEKKCQDIDSQMASDKLVEFLRKMVGRFFELLRLRVKAETSLEGIAVIVRALDRFYRRLQAMCRLLPQISTNEFAKSGLDLILNASQDYAKMSLAHLKGQLMDTIMDTRKSLVAPPRTSEPGDTMLNELNAKVLTEITEQIRGQLANLKLFIDPEVTFTGKSQYRRKFCRLTVREGVVVEYFNHILGLMAEFCDDRSDKNVPPPVLLLLLSKTCRDLQANTIHYILNYVDEQFFIDDTSGGLTTSQKMSEKMRAAAQKLLDHYVHRQGQIVSAMLRKSVETRDWLNTVEPRTVRAVMKRVVEEITSIDRQVGGVYEEGARKTRSSDSSRRSGARYSKRSAGGWSALSGGAAGMHNTSLASNIQKMFNEKIEIFSRVEFSRISILTGVVKISLKTLLECVRLRTFSRFGFQQMQVDAHYLYIYLWRFVSDENLVTFLLDEIMTSAVHRCLDPSPMEASVVEVICDRG